MFLQVVPDVPEHRDRAEAVPVQVSGGHLREGLSQLQPQEEPLQVEGAPLRHEARHQQVQGEPPQPQQRQQRRAAEEDLEGRDGVQAVVIEVSQMKTK